MPHARHLRLIFLAAGALALLGRAAAAPDGPDPVLDLEQALKAPVLDPANAEELKYRGEQLKKQADRLRLGDLRRALVLQYWRDEEREEGLAKVDGAVRGALLDRLEKGLTRQLTEGSPAARMAAVTEIGEMGIAPELTTSSSLQPASKTNLTQSFIRGSGGRLPPAMELAPQVIKALGDQDAAVRVAAARALGRVNPDPKPATDALAAALVSGPQPLRLAAAESLGNLLRVLDALGRMRGTTGVDVPRGRTVVLTEQVARTALKGLGDPDLQVRRYCVEALRLSADGLRDLVVDLPRQEFPPADRPWTMAEREVVDRYRKEVEEEREQLLPATRALEQATRELARLLSEPRTAAEMRLQALQTLDAVGAARMRMARKADAIPRPGKAPEPKDDPDPLRAGLVAALPALAARLGDADVRVRRAALDVIESLAREKELTGYVAVLVRALADPDRFVRWAALRILGKSGPIRPGQTVPAVARLLGDADLDVQIAAANTLQRFGVNGLSAVEALARQINSGDVEGRVEMMDTLAYLGAPAATGPVLKELAIALGDDDSRVRKAAADTLRFFGPAASSAVPALERALNDPDDSVRKAASDALLSVTEKK